MIDRSLTPARRAELLRQAAVDPVMATMVRLKSPLTRTHYLALSFMGEPPDPLPAEYGADILPEVADLP